MANVDLNAKLPAGTYVYVGRRQLRHKDEPNEKQEVMLEIAPEAYPHTFIDFSGVQLKDVLEHAGGKQGCVVDAQKVIRDKSTLAEVKAWRAAFDDPTDVLEKCGNISEEAANDVFDGEPYVVLKFATAGSKLDVPKQPADMLKRLKEEASVVYEAMLANLSEEEQLKLVPAIYQQLEAAMKS